MKYTSYEVLIYLSHKLDPKETTLSRSFIKCTCGDERIVFYTFFSIYIIHKINVSCYEENILSQVRPFVYCFVFLRSSHIHIFICRTYVQPIFTDYNNRMKKHSKKKTIEYKYNQIKNTIE